MQCNNGEYTRRIYVLPSVCVYQKPRHILFYFHFLSVSLTPSPFLSFLFSLSTFVDIIWSDEAFYNYMLLWCRVDIRCCIFVCAVLEHRCSTLLVLDWLTKRAVTNTKKIKKKKRRKKEEK